jgi:hypothetical protein
MQRGWSAGLEANLLAANSGSGWFNSGSGIFSNGTVLTSIYNTYLPQSNLLIADVPVLRNVVEANHSDARAQGSSAPPPPATATIDAHAVPLPRESLAGTIRAEVESVKCSIAYKIRFAEAGKLNFTFFSV